MNLSIYSLYLDMQNFGLSIFVTQLVYGVFEVPSVLLSMWLLEILGRKILFIATLLIGGVSSILILAVPDGKSFVISQNTFSIVCLSCLRSLLLIIYFIMSGYAISVTSLAVASRFFLIWAGSVCMVFMQELFPTSVR